MKILVVDSTAKVFSLECESTDTIAHIKAKLKKITGNLMFDGKVLRADFSENMTLADIGVKDGSLILEEYSFQYRSCRDIERPPRRSENDYLHYADAFKSGWREEHAKALLHLLLELCHDGTISEGNVTDEAWLRIQNNLNNSMKCSFQIDFLKERLCDYKQLYSVLTETSPRIFHWARERKTITISSFDDWREEYPELLLLCGPHIPYFDTLEEVCLLANTSNLSPMGSSTSIGKENGYHSSTMKILVVDETAKVFSLECESTDTIAHLKAKWNKITRELMFDGKGLGDNLSENMTLADVGVQDGSLILESCPWVCRPMAGSIERPLSQRRIPEKDYLYYADAFKSGWREEHAKALLHLLLELCQDGTISEGNVTDEAWLRIQNNLNNSKKCCFQIDFLKERLCDYKQLYSVLAETTSSPITSNFLKERLCDYKQLYSVLTETSSPIFEWDRERKTVTLQRSEWKQDYPELLLLCGPYIPYFDTLEKVCLLLNTGQSSEQRVSES